MNPGLAPQAEEKLTAERKALLVNLDPRFFGTFAEIGAGQEVARYFFRVGGAAGTIAKTMSAYDMTFSDAIYGKVGRYVSRSRLISMLEHEYKLLLERLSAKRGADTSFFVFADTVATRNYQGTNECHGWMGVRFQTDPQSPPNDIVIHVRMTDNHHTLQQQALGVIGVNLVYGAFFYRDDPDKFVQGLLDDLSPERIEVDMIEFHGPAFNGLDNRLLSLKLVEQGLTAAVMIGPDGRIMQPSEVLYKKAVLVERGSFRPVTHVNVDMIAQARQAFGHTPDGADVVSLFEITLHNLLSTGSLDAQDFLARADTISALGQTVLISNFAEFYSLIGYFRRYTRAPIGVAVGMNGLLQLFEERFYERLEGGVLEGIGRLFRNGVKMYVYPMSRNSYVAYAGEKAKGMVLADRLSVHSIDLLSGSVQHLYRYLLDINAIVAVEPSEARYLEILSRTVLDQIARGDTSWETSVPSAAAQVIKKRGMYGCKF